MYQMGVYCRLSKDDGENKISESIENQMKLIREYVSKSEDLEIADIYIDDGYSGLYFANRPEFQRMMEDIYKGKIKGLCFLIGHALLLECFELGLVVLVESDIAVANEVVAFCSGAFGRCVVEPPLPCQHRFADMYAAVVYDICLYHFVAASLKDV